MKNNNLKTSFLIKATLVTLLFSTSICATNVYAGSKQKPPVADITEDASWYGDLLNLLGL